MDNKAIKRKLKDASLYLSDAAKAWPKYPQTAIIRLDGACNIIEDVWENLERPMGGEKEE